jgi:hypothetical protein
MIMNIFDFIPSHLRAPGDSKNAVMEPIDTISGASPHSQQIESLAPSHLTRPDQYKLMLQEWEQACYSEWVEMEQDICLFSA